MTGPSPAAPTPAPPPSRRARISRAALYAGGLMGPFAASVVASMLPELGESFGRTADQAAAAIPAYFLPFALTMLVSGTLGQRWGVARTVAVGYLVFTAATVLAAVSTTWWMFQTARGLQGLANAFTTPLLLATLGRTVPRARLGAALGLFAAMQAVGQVCAPLFGGLFAQIDWRYAFFAVSVAGVALLLAGVPRTGRPSGQAPARLRSAWTLPVLRLCAVYFVVGGTLTGLSFLVALYAEDRFGLGPGARGLLLTGAGVLAIVTARGIGRGVDRRGWLPIGVGGLLLGVLAMGLMPVLPAVAALALLWALVGAANQAALVSLNSKLLSLPDAGGAVSVGQAARFLGTAAAPVLILPIYAWHQAWAFWLPTLVVAMTVVALLVLGSRRRPTTG